MTGPPSEAEIAAANNADLCAAIMTAHGLRFQRDRSAFYAVDEPPPYYPHLITLEPGTNAQQTMRLRDLERAGQPIASIKDSFADLDHATLGMSVLFEAFWIWHEGGHQTMPAGWRRVRDPAELDDWQTAWRKAGSPTDQVIFPPAVLNDPDLVVLTRRSASAIDAGCIANLSAKVTGLSNVFAAEQASTVFAQAAQAVSSLRPRTPVVGYETGANLDAAWSSGFRTVGDLRVLVRQG